MLNALIVEQDLFNIGFMGSCTDVMFAVKSGRNKKCLYVVELETLVTEPMRELSWHNDKALRQNYPGPDLNPGSCFSSTSI